MLRRLSALWAVLNTPSDFKGDPYSALLNQWGHYAMGAGVFIFTCCACYVVLGQMPSRPLVAWSLIGFYVLVIEWRIQGWRGWDSVEDALFVAMGILTVSTTVHEVGSNGWVSTIDLHVGNLMLSLGAATAACIVYAVARVRNG